MKAQRFAPPAGCLGPSKRSVTEQMGRHSRPDRSSEPAVRETTGRTPLSIGSLLCPSRAKNMPQISFTAPKAHGALAGAGRVLETLPTARGRTSPPRPTT